MISSSNNNSGNTRLETLDDDGQPPRSVVKDAAAAHQLKRTMIMADIGRAAARGTLKGMYDGNAPKNQQKLNARGMGDSTNVNMRRASTLLPLLESRASAARRSPLRRPVISAVGDTKPYAASSMWVGTI